MSTTLTLQSPPSRGGKRRHDVSDMDDDDVNEEREIPTTGDIVWDNHPIQQQPQRQRGRARSNNNHIDKRARISHVPQQIYDELHGHGYDNHVGSHGDDYDNDGDLASPSLAIEGVTTKRRRYDDNIDITGQRVRGLITDDEGVPIDDNSELGVASSVQDQAFAEQVQHHTLNGPMSTELVQYLTHTQQSTYDKVISLEKEVIAQKYLNTNLMNIITKKDNENKILGRGMSIADNRLKDVQNNIQLINHENLMLRQEIDRLRSAMQPAAEYVKKLESTINQMRIYIENKVSGNDSSSSSSSGDGFGGGFGGGFDGPPPDVF